MLVQYSNGNTVICFYLACAFATTAFAADSCASSGFRIDFELEIVACDVIELEIVVCDVMVAVVNDGGGVAAFVVAVAAAIIDGCKLLLLLMFDKSFLTTWPDGVVDLIDEVEDVVDEDPDEVQTGCCCCSCWW